MYITLKRPDQTDVKLLILERNSISNVHDRNLSPNSIPGEGSDATIIYNFVGEMHEMTIAFYVTDRTESYVEGDTINTIWKFRQWFNSTFRSPDFNVQYLIDFEPPTGTEQYNAMLHKDVWEMTVPGRMRVTLSFIEGGVPTTQDTS